MDERNTIRAVALLLAGVLMMCGCTTWRAPVRPPAYALFSKVRAPLTVPVQGTPSGGRVGAASTVYFRDPFFTGLDFAWDEASIAAAAREGNLSTVHYADYEILQVLGIFGRFTIRAHGE